MRKDKFKNYCQNDMTSYDLNCGDIYKHKWRGKLKRTFRRMARRRLINQINDYIKEN